MATDILICGTGIFAERILCDLAATADEALSVVIAGRNGERLEWLKTAAAARAAIFGKRLSVATHVLDFAVPDAIAECLARIAPRVIVQAASAQASSVLGASENGWSRLVAETSYSVTALFQAFLSIRIARAAKNACPGAYFVNCCYPDVVDGILRALDLPIACGLGNVAILASIMAAHSRGRGRNVKVLAHYQTLTPWRSPCEERNGPAPRVWIDGVEVADVFGTFADIKLTRAPVIEISGAANVPMLAAMAARKHWAGHAPGPHGLPGGYPVAFDGERLDLDLPPGLGHDEAVAWNAKFEKTDGLSISDDRRLVFAGNLQARLNILSPALAAGFAIADFDAAHNELTRLRVHLQSQP